MKEDEEDGKERREVRHLKETSFDTCNETKRQTERQRESERKRERQTNIERELETYKQTEKEEGRKTETDIYLNPLCSLSKIIAYLQTNKQLKIKSI